MRTAEDRSQKTEVRRTALALSVYCLLSTVFFVFECSATEKWKDIDGKEHALFSTDEKRATVLIFITHDCPIANTYAPEIKRIITAYAEKTRFFLVHVDYDLTDEKARTHTKDFGYETPVVIDKKHKLVARAKATVTPEAAIISHDGKVLYCGRINDKHADFGKERVAPTVHDLRNAIDAVLAGKEAPKAGGEAIGCAIPELRK